MAMHKYKRYLYDVTQKVPRCTILKRKRAASEGKVCRRRNRVQYGLPGNANINTEQTLGQDAHDSLIGIEVLASSSAHSDNHTADIPITQNVQSLSAGVCSSMDLDDDTYGFTDYRNCINSDEIESDSSSERGDGITYSDSINQDHADIQVFKEDLNFNQENKLEDTLCECVTTTANDILLMTLSLGLRHNLSWVAQVDILNMINTIYKDDKVPSSKYLYLKQIDDNSTSFKYHFFCERCGQYLGERVSLPDPKINCECGQIIDTQKAQSFFVSLSIKDQLSSLLQKTDIANSIFSYRFNRVKESPDNIEDIYDGKEYQKHFLHDGILSIPQNFSYSFNTDGMPIGKSSKKTLWPIYITINELCPEDRGKFVLLAGLYIGSKDPNQKMFLEPFVNQATELASTGFTWNHEGSEIHSHVIPLCAIVDSVARYQMLDFSSYVAYYGCTFCYNKSERTRNGLRFTINFDKNKRLIQPRARTRESTIEDLKIVHEKRFERSDEKKRHKGVKGPSPLLWLTFFDLISGFVPDYMHSVLQGVVKLHMELLFDSTRKKFWVDMTDRIAMNTLISAIDARLLATSPPSVVTRTPRSLIERALWKASEWRAWLVLYSVPCLKGLLKKKYLVHLSMLSTAVGILLQKSISKEQLETAENLLVSYVIKFQKYFGKENMVFNVHLLTHIPCGVLNWGPLWTHNCFLYEGKNRHMLQMYQSPNQVVKQLVRKFLIFGNMPSFISERKLSLNVVQYCEEILNKRMKNFMSCKGVTLLGRGKWFKLNDEEVSLFRARAITIDGAEFFDAMLYKHCRFSVEEAPITKRTNNSYILLSGGKFAQIKKILWDCKENQVYIIVLLLNTRGPISLNDRTYGTFVTQFVAVHDNSQELVVITPNNIDNICVYFDTTVGLYICSVSYGCLSDG